MRKIPLLALALAGLFLLATGACSSEELDKDIPPYEGPFGEAEDVTTLYSDSAIVRVKLQAAKQFEFESGDREFPMGLYIEFFEIDGNLSATLVADHGYFFADVNRYTGVGNVEVEGHKDQNKLLTDTLHWSPAEQKVYTKAFVTIIEDADTLTGQGLEAAQDFSYYTILKPDGSTILDELGEGPQDDDDDDDDEDSDNAGIGELKP